MSDHFDLTLADLIAEIAKDDAKVAEKKRAVNSLCAMKGRPPAFPNIESEATAASTGTLLGDEYYSKRQHTACRMILERRKALGLGPATIDDFYRDLVAGGYPFAAKNDEIARKGLANMLTQNTAVFIRLPNGKFSIRDWYPNAKKPVDLAARPKVGAGDGKVDVEAAETEPDEETDPEA